VLSPIDVMVTLTAAAGLLVRRGAFGGAAFPSAGTDRTGSGCGFDADTTALGGRVVPGDAAVALTGRCRAGDAAGVGVRVFWSSSASNGNWSSTPFGLTSTVDPSMDSTRADVPAARSSDGIGSRR
jgi:hypothetical protein